MMHCQVIRAGELSGRTWTRRPADVRALGAATVTTAGVIVLVATRPDLRTALYCLGALACGWLVVTPRRGAALLAVSVYIALFDGFLKLRFGGNAFVLGRDALVLSAFAGEALGWLRSRAPLRLPPITGWVLLWAAIVLAQLLNPNTDVVGRGLPALRQHLEFVPYFFLGYATIRTEGRLRAALVFLLIVSAINGVVSAVQFNLSKEQFAAWGPGYRERVLGLGVISGRSFVDSAGGEHVRPFGLGSDIGFAGVLGVLAVPAALTLLTAVRGSRRLIPTIALAALVALAIVTSQSRASVLAAVFTAAVFAALSTTVTGRVWRTLTAVTVTGVLVYVVVAVVGSTLQGGTFDRFKSISPNKVVSTTVGYRSANVQLTQQYAEKFPFGAGMGSVGPASSTNGATPTSFDAETQFNYLVVETGVPGLLVMIGLHLAVLGLGLRTLLRHRGTRVALLLAALLAPVFTLFALWFSGATTSAPPGATYLWFAAGVFAYWSGRPADRREATPVR